MKAKILLILLAIAYSNPGISQDFNKVKAANSVVWFGLDFSMVKLIGVQENFNDLDKIKNYYFAEWNFLVLREAEKYNIGKFYLKNNVEDNIEIAVKRSTSISTDNIVTLSTKGLTQDDIKSIISDYKIDTKTEIGLLYVVESLDKIHLEVTAWVTFFDIKTGEIIYTKRATGKVGGAGFRNYWIRGVYNIMNSTKF